MKKAADQRPAAEDDSGGVERGDQLAVSDLDAGLLKLGESATGGGTLAQQIMQSGARDPVLFGPVGLRQSGGVDGILNGARELHGDAQCLSEIRNSQVAFGFTEWTPLLPTGYAIPVAKTKTAEARPELVLTLGAQLVREIEDHAANKDITQKELLVRAKLPDGSAAVGLTAFASWKNGETSPTIEKLEALCAVIDECLTARVEPLVSAPPKAQPASGGSRLFEESRKAVALIQTVKDPARRKEAYNLLKEYVQAWGGAEASLDPLKRDA